MDPIRLLYFITIGASTKQHSNVKLGQGGPCKLYNIPVWKVVDIAENRNTNKAQLSVRTALE